MDSNTCSLRGNIAATCPAMDPITGQFVQVAFPGVRPGDMIILSPWIQFYGGGDPNGTIATAGSVSEDDKIDLLFVNMSIALTFPETTLVFAVLDIRATGSI